MKIVRLTPGQPTTIASDGCVLARDITVDGDGWHKGRRLSAGDMAALAGARVVRIRGLAAGDEAMAASVPVLLVGPHDLHEDDAARRIATAVGGPGVELRGPVESRVDLVATHAGVLRVDERLLARIDGWDPVAVFTALDGQIVSAGAIVAAAKVGPHVVPASVVERVERALAGAAARGRHVVRVDGFARRRIAAVVKETISGSAGPGFAATVAARVEELGSQLTAIVRVPDDAAGTTDALRALASGPEAVDVILTAGAASTDPGDPFFVAVGRLRGRILSRGVPAHPGSMLWVGRVGRTVLLGLPTCGAYSRATAVDLLLPWILAGAPADRRTIARLGHGGLLTREMRFRFPAYTRGFDAPEG